MAAERSKDSATLRYAVVTGANKGIGFGICKQLAANGITVVLTARNEQRGLEAAEKLKESGLSDNVLFHQLDVADPSSVSALAEFIRTRFGRLDILVNNAGVGGVAVKAEARKDLESGGKNTSLDWSKILIETYDLAVECQQINYFGAKRMIETFIPLLQDSDSARIVSISSSMGQLENIPSDWAKGVLSDAESLTGEKVDEVVNEFLKDFKEGCHKEKGWPLFMPAYTISKAALNSFTRVIAKRYPAFKVNAVCPGFVKTDINLNQGILSVDEGAESAVRLCMLCDDGPSGTFFIRKDESSF